MLLWAVLLIFWSLVPGLITGWMFRERGRNFAPGLFTGAVFGPLGILGALTFIYIGDRRRARDRVKGRGRAVRVFYEIPVVGRLHVSTVWALAGVATFLCLWMVGGVVYELQRTDRVTDPSEMASDPEPGRITTNSLRAGAPANDSRPAAPAQANTSSQPKSAILGNIPVQPGQTGSGAPQPENSSTQNGRPLPNTSGAAPARSLQFEQTAPQPSVPAAPESPAPAPTAKAPAQSRESVVSEVTRDLASMGHRAHAALSGSGRSTTLSLSGASLTREAGSRLLGNSRTRESLKSAGVRVVVMLNGEESWTFIL